MKALRSGRMRHEFGARHARIGNTSVIERVVLDLDGPLLEGSARHYACYSGILDDAGFKPMERSLYWQVKRERMDRRRQLAVSGAESLYELFLSRWLERIEQDEYLDLDALQPGVLETLERWRRLDVRLILATQRRNHDGLDRQLRRFGIARFFDHILPCEHASGGEGKGAEVHAAVPDFRPEQTLWVGDTEVDIEAARSLGCRVCAVTCGLRTESYLASLHPDFLVSGIADVDVTVL